MLRSLAAVLALCLVVGCAPRSEYRHTAYIPAARPLAWDGRTEREGALRVEGAVTGTDVEKNWAPKLGDTALYVPGTTLEALAAAALTNGLELGFRGAYADWAWAQESAIGTMPIPEHPSVWGVGPEARGVVHLSEHVSLGFAGNLLGYSISVARWHLDSTCTPSARCIQESSFPEVVRYRYVGTKQERFLVTSLALYSSVTFGPKAEYGHVFFGPSVHEGFRNDGFTNFVDESSGSTLERAGFVWFLGAGYGIVLEGLRLSAMAAVPVSRHASAVNYNLAAFVTIGTSFALWGDDASSSLDAEQAARN